MSGLQVKRYQYANHWPIWCVVDGEQVILCRETEAGAGEMLRDMDKAKGAAQPDTKRGTTRSNDVTASPTLAEIGITKQAQDYELENNAARIRLRAERKIGQQLAEMPKAKGAAGAGNNNVTGGNIVAPPDAPPTLAEIGITKRQSSDWQNERGAK